MLVGSPIYCLLLIPLVLVFYNLPVGRPRAILLTVASWGYYLTFPTSFFLALAFVTLVAYFGAIAIEHSAERERHQYLFVAIAIFCILPLLAIKYVVPLLASTSRHTGADWDFTVAQLAFPVGLSFYTFGALGYLTDVAIGVASAEKNFIRVSLFCGFFPIVTAGPIPRSMTILPQMSFARSFEAERSIRGVTEILIGVLLKFWISDELSSPVTEVYAHLSGVRPIELFLGNVFFAFQLYADFAGYSLIAIGSARLFGVDVPPNFREPFLASSIAEFWRGWHMSLLGWLRDYIFTPIRLQSRRFPRLRTDAATLLTLLLVGIWHGAGWGFVVFGLVHGVLMIVGQWTQSSRDRLWASLVPAPQLVRVLRIPSTFLIVCLTFILFRAQNMGEAIQIYRSLFSFDMIHDIMGFVPAAGAPVPVFQFINCHQHGLAIALLVMLFFGDVAAKYTTRSFFRWPYPVRALVYSAGTLTIIIQAISSGSAKPFAYFQF